MHIVSDDHDLRDDISRGLQQRGDATFGATRSAREALRFCKITNR